MTPLKVLKALPARIKSTAFGYMRRYENRYSILNMPLMIYYLILRFYFHGEYFEKAGNALEISNDKMSVERTTIPTSTTIYSNNVYGKTWIRSNIKQVIKWRFKIDSFGYEDDEEWHQGDVFVAIVSKDNRLNEDFEQREDKPYACVRMPYQDSTKINTLIMDSNRHNDQQSKIFFEGDETRNAFVKTGDNIHYKLAICLTGKGAKITLIDFEIDSSVEQSLDLLIDED